MRCVSLFCRAFLSALLLLASCRDGTLDPKDPVSPATVGTIEGSILDEDGFPIAGAQIIGEAGTIVTTDSAGKYMLPNLEGGTYVIVVSKNDYDSQAELITVTPGKTSAANIRLKRLARVPVKGLVAYYPFTGSANDEGGNSYNGIAGGVNYTADRFGRNSAACAFDGLDDFVAVPGARGTLLEPAQEMTLSCFIKPQKDQAAFSIRNIIGKADNKGYMLSLAKQTSGLALKVDLNCRIDGQSWNTSVEEDATGLIDGWHHALVTYSTKTRALNLYMDGRLILSRFNCTYDFQHSSDTLFIGGPAIRPGSMVRSLPFFGAIDEVRIYNRVLSAQEIDILANEGIAK